MPKRERGGNLYECQNELIWSTKKWGEDIDGYLHFVLIPKASFYL